jgi:DNA-binding YbaB/EbfC family protein
MDDPYEDDLPEVAGDPGGDPAAILGGFDLGAVLEQAGQMQAQLMAAQEQAAATVVEGVAGGGAVKVAVTGTFEFRSVTIAPEAVDPAEVDMLQDLVLAALHDAAARVQELQQQGLDLGGMDLGGLFGGS